jgi:pimeloyl-ACP methyl ester carboxylesterase
MPQYGEWTPEECSKVVRRDALLEEHIVEQYIDSIDEKRETFFLYYFVKDLTFENREKPTALFAAGGPGQMVLASSGENFVDLLGYRVVYFHLRGTGFSQLPKDTSCDQYLRTDYVVKDVEAIRRDYLGDTKWAAVIGHSYGAVVAQCYAHEFPDRVEKVVLSAPILPVSVLIGNQLVRGSSSVEPKPLESLRRIYERDDFAFLDDIRVGKNSASTKEYIVSRGEDIVKEVERLYWNVQFVADEYTRLEQQLKKDDLDLGAPFFSAVRKLRLCGWLPLDVPLARGGDIEVDTAQLESGLIIADAILKKFTRFTLREEVEKQMTNASDQKKDNLKIVLVALDFSNRSIPVKSSQNTARAYYVISLYDGLNEKFLRELQPDSDKKGIQSIVDRNGSNRSLEKAASELTKAPEPWDPAKKKHGCPTLILKGGADPLNELGEAQYYFDHGLTGDRALIEFPGVGHSMALPHPLLNSGAGINAITIERNGKSNEESLGTREALIHAFLAKTYVEFKETKILIEIDAAFGDALNGFEKSRPWNKKSGRPSKLGQERLIKQFRP